MESNVSVVDEDTHQNCAKKNRPLKLNKPVRNAHAVRLCSLGLARRSLDDIRTLTIEMRKWSQKLHSLLQFPEFVTLFPEEKHSVENLFWLISFKQHNVNPPARFSLFAYPNHANQSTPTVYRAAFKQALLLRHQLDKIGEEINVNALPSTEKTLQAVETLLSTESSVTFNQSIKISMQRLNSAFVRPLNINDPTTIGQLQSLQQLYKDIESFYSVEVYQKELGPFFRGLETDWQELRDYMKFSQALRCINISDHRLRHIISEWERYENSFNLVVEKTAEAQKELGKLVQAFEKISGQKAQLISAELLVTYAQTLSKEIDIHQQALMYRYRDDNLTPVGIISTTQPESVLA